MHPIGNSCLLSIGVKVLPKVLVGPNSRISAGTIVTESIPPSSFVLGNPMKVKPDGKYLKDRINSNSIMNTRVHLDTDQSDNKDESLKKVQKI